MEWCGVIFFYENYEEMSTSVRLSRHQEDIPLIIADQGVFLFEYSGAGETIRCML
jgi:hypothetical protein